jgi:hypothetical protein
LNAGGGIVMNSVQYSIVNTFVVGNASGTTPAIFIGPNSSELSASQGGLGFRHNVVAKNSNTAGVAGISCNAGISTIADSIIVGNTGGNLGGGSTCSLTYCNTDTVPLPAGTGNNDDAAPDFVNPMAPAYDFHLMGKSTNNLTCCVDKIPAPDPVDHDYFGTPRPQGPKWDIGADELK